MADNVAYTAGSGTTIAADEVVDGTLGTVKVQYIKLMDGTLDGTTKASVGANGLSVDVRAMVVLPAGTNIIGKVGIDQTTPGTTNLVALASNQSVNTAQINGVATSTGTGVMGTGVQRVAIASDNDALTIKQATAANLNATVTNVAITKGAQGATGVTTQDLKDAGRSARTITLDSFAVVATAETLMTMSYSTDNGALTTGTSYTVTTAKRFRIQAILASIHTIVGNTTAVNCILRMRVNNAGAGIVTSPVQLIAPIPGIAAANGSSGPNNIAVPDGWEFVAGAGVAFTITCSGFVATVASPKVDLTIIGYEY